MGVRIACVVVLFKYRLFGLSHLVVYGVALGVVVMTHNRKCTTRKAFSLKYNVSFVPTHLTHNTL